MIHDIDLRELSEYQGPDRVFLSVYVSGAAGAQAVDHRLRSLRELFADEGDEHDELAHLDRNIELVQAWLEENPPLQQGTTCVFACYALDLLRGFRIEFELPTRVHVDVAPYLRPLAELQDEYQTFAVVAADNHATRVFLITGKQNELVGRVRGDVKNHVKKGGWSQKRYQRRRGNELHHYAAEVATFLDDLSRSERFDRIVLAGSEEAMVAIGGALDPVLAERVIARDKVDLKEGDEALVADAFEHYWEAERAAERELWQRIRAEYKAGGLAALGPADVLQAVQNGRVDAMLVDRSADLPALRCSECENTAAGTPDTCPFCGAAAGVPVDLIDELTRQAQLTGADVEFADPIRGLGKAGGVAALLRY
jgi:peptide subunit release factor 1 (eRF1)